MTQKRRIGEVLAFGAFLPLLAVHAWAQKGSTAGTLTTGRRLASKGVIVVSVAYRVGPLGYLVHPGLSAESKDHVSGNYGVLDLIAGLQWVKKNTLA